MKYTTEKKQTIVLYILEKIVAETQSLSKVVQKPLILAQIRFILI